MKTLQVSRTTARFIANGHPWVRPDRFTRGLEQLRAGDPVVLVDERGTRLASALAAPQDEICARVYHRSPDYAFDPAAALRRAWKRREGLHSDPETDCYRVVHGEADFLPGLRVERYGSIFVVLVLAACAAPAVGAVCETLLELQPQAKVVVREHRDDLRREEVVSRQWSGGALEPDAVVIGREFGVRYPLLPFAGLATGIYVDQRATRAWLRPQAAGKRVVNLFAYTGAFSLSLLAAGAVSGVDVDLAAPALARAREAAELNGLDGRHRVVQQDCRGYLAASQDQADLIICDPPTAAQGGDGWVLRRDYGEVLRLAIARLAPGGLLVACCNTMGRPFPLHDAVSSAATAAGVEVADVAAPDPAADIPISRGFPEGRPYRLVAVRRAQ
ncbi:MAG: class I SAM-dependent rRNA methyltransferase [Planctomycetes bacterium]|nr:class I SAM-dependent rRNA methyltransferase [Planctomycetota bacterium]